jgi:hypothetical protein
MLLKEIGIERVNIQEFQGAWCQDKLIGGKPPVIK